MELQCGEPPLYIHIERNEFIYRKHKKQKEEDIVICVCQYDASDPDSACGDQCLNVLTSTECTPGYCPCGDNCKNQKFQNCAYAKARLFRTEGRGWGLLADEDIKAGQFVIEYCGEVISWKEAKRRSQLYETGGLKDAYIIYLNADESIDATQKGSLARFINHSCQPNCETRKWNVLGEIRVGIFAKQDIPTGAELSYDYNFEWYGGTKVRCLCGASCCSEFLGAKSRGFQESTYLWEDDDDRYSVENIPLYDSEDDEPTSKLLKAIVPVNSMPTVTSEDTNYLDSTASSQSEPMIVEPLNVLPMEVDESTKIEDSNKYSANAQAKYAPKNAMISKIKSTSACRNYLINSSPLPKTSHHPGGRSKVNERKQIDTRHICERLVSRDAREEIFDCEEIRKDAASELDALYDEIRPAIEEHERDSQGSVSTSLAEKWIEASCRKMKAEFDLSFAIIKSIASNPRKAQHSANSQAEGMPNEIKYLENEVVLTDRRHGQ